MLILTRKVGERINIGEDIFVNVLEINNGNVKLGIEAPKDITIFRQEVYERIKQENIESASGKSIDLLRAVKLLEKELNG